MNNDIEAPNITYTPDQLVIINNNRARMLAKGTISIVVAFLMVLIAICLWVYDNNSVTYIISISGISGISLITFVYGVVKIHDANELSEDAMSRY